jgi:hypothetical protein
MLFITLTLTTRLNFYQGKSLIITTVDEKNLALKSSLK